MKTSEKSRNVSFVHRAFSCLSHLCAYRHLYQVLTMLIGGKQLSEQIKAGRNIALLGFFCPIFWIALFTAADTSTLLLHAAHSGIVFLIGVIIMVIGYIKQKSN